MTDYKSRNPIAPTWAGDEFSSWRTPEPYDVPTGARLHEVDTPDLSTVLLMQTGELCPENTCLSWYAIEAPRDCSMRRAFEWGEISWLDFWFHTGWLLRINMPLNPGPVTSSYILPSQMDASTLNFLEKLEGQFPYGLKQEQLKLSCRKPLFRPFRKFERERVERRYQQFMAQYGHRFSQDVA